MSTGISANVTHSTCSDPLLDPSGFGLKGGYQPGRYCGLDLVESGTTCCFPCPIQDWIYSSDWNNQLRVPNYLSIFSVVLCFFLLVSFAILPASATHRHYLSVGLLVSVLFISLSFVMPVGTDPEMCYDDITPNNMGSSILCAWTGSLLTLGGLGCAIWVFLRSLWLHIRIFWDHDPGRIFKWGSIIVGSVLPIIFLIAVLTATGFSFRMGQTCFPNHENAIITFWVWLVAFAATGFLLQVATTGYCVWVYMRSIRRGNQGHQNPTENRRANRKSETWANVKRIFLLQWRNILVSILTIVGSIAFFIVFWVEDDKLRRIFHDPGNIDLVQRWMSCQTLLSDDKEECKNYVKDLTVPQASVLTSLILASLVGIEIFVLLFRLSMLTAWRDLLRAYYQHISPIHRPPSPELTSFENPDRLTPLIPKISPYISEFSLETQSMATSDYSSNVELGGIPSIKAVYQRLSYERIASDQFLLPPASLSGTIDQESDNTVESGDASKTPLRMNSVSSRFSKLVPSRASSIQRTKSSKVRGRISIPVPGSFVHVDGVDVKRTPNEETERSQI